ncbi:unnamed protein product (macronuclear) [Paramecium tetraurelia]|uniref:Uncharacterized protein n=1 Tax=Paramecium tetraurelia TaxID=5888 RepID=A0C702_PARTE|nr:uncharacterized protein GSPATT00035698001 [Paramecium tetraurelia]CAK66569.1 unnamed protein product [Paramecium tetraurelia]|eukprot:XP_001433966.1 hypothetical protein (macronuclear) [Paramecium tetraurelia strain d4-2]
MILFLCWVSLLPLIYSYVDLETSFTNNRFTAADKNGWTFVYMIDAGNAATVTGMTGNRDTDLEKSQCLTSDGSCTDPNAVQYFGLGLLGEFAGAFKVFENLPPHCQIYISVDLAIKGREISTSRLLVLLDILPVAAYTINPSGDTDFYEAVTLQGVASHSYPFVLISFHTAFYVLPKSMGIRNLKIKYTPCPPGCLICTLMDVQVQCSQWVLGYEGLGLTSKLLSNDGWQITNSKEQFKNLNQDVNTISYVYCLSPGLGPFTQNQDVQIDLFLDPHYEVRFVFYLISIYTDTRFPPMIVVRLDGLEVYSLNIKTTIPLINFCQWEAYNYVTRKEEKLTRRVDFNYKTTKRKLNLSLRTQTITVPIIYDQTILKDFQVYIKKCYSEPNFPCDECIGPLKNDCVQKAKVTNFQQIAANDFSTGHGWQVMLPETGGVQICNGRYYFGLDSTKITTSYIQKSFSFNNPHTDIEISFIIQKIDKHTTEKFQIYLDDALIEEIPFSTFDSQFSYCGTSENDGQLFYQKKIAHTRSYSVIQMKSTQTTTDGLFGIYNFKLKVRNGQESQDLYNDLSNIPIVGATQWNKWIVTQSSNDLKQYVCDSSVTLLGKLQPEMQIRRFVQNIAVHTQIRIQFTIYLFTSSFNNKILTLILNNKTIWEQTINWYNQKACDANLDTFVVKGDIVMDHELDHAFFVWSSSVSDLTASWGIADFKLFIS